MELQHRFTVPAGIDETWAHFEDIEGVARCFPGATVTEADAESFSGTVKVKLGPIALVYNGTGTFVEKDRAARRLVIDAKGKDKRGNGTAGATVTATMTEAGPDATDVEVATDLSITGKAAQFGRGNVIKDVSDKLLGQFVACLEQRFADSGEQGADAAGAAASGAGTAAPPTEPPAAEPGGEEPVAGEPAPVAPEVPETEPYRSAAPPGDAGTGADQSATPPAAPPPPAEPPPRDDAINLGSTVLPVLVRAYWKPVAVVVVVVVLLVLWWLVARD